MVNSGKDDGIAGYLLRATSVGGFFEVWIHTCGNTIIDG